MNTALGKCTFNQAMMSRDSDSHCLNDRKKIRQLIRFNALTVTNRGAVSLPLPGGGGHSRQFGCSTKTFKPWYVSAKLLTYPSPKQRLTLTSHLGQNVGLGEG